MKIKLLTGMAGDTFSYAPGEVVDMDEATAQRLVKSGQAEPVSVTTARNTRTKKVKETR